MELSKISKDIIENHMVRRTRKQKDSFISFLQDSLSIKDTLVNVDESRCGLGKNRNIVIGDITKAKYIFTAHYDTPRGLSILGPHFISTSKLRKRVVRFYGLVKGATFICSMIYILFHLIYQFSSLNFFLVLLISYIFAFILLASLVLTAPINKKNYNDNTSGVVTILETALYPEEYHKDIVAFVLFDNEEWGCKGSKIMYKKSKHMLKNKTIINFDCVSDGDSFLFSCKPSVLEDAQVYDNLKNSFVSTQNKQMVFINCKKFKVSSSDHISFYKSVGITALKKCKGKGNWIYLDKMHTKKDTNFDIENISFLVKSNIDLICSYILQKNQEDKDGNVLIRKVITGVNIPEMAIK